MKNKLNTQAETGAKTAENKDQTAFFADDFLDFSLEDWLEFLGQNGTEKQDAEKTAETSLPGLEPDAGAPAEQSFSNLMNNPSDITDSFLSDPVSIARLDNDGNDLTPLSGAGPLSEGFARFYSSNFNSSVSLSSSNDGLETAYVLQQIRTQNRLNTEPDDQNSDDSSSSDDAGNTGGDQGPNDGGSVDANPGDGVVKVCPTLIDSIEPTIKPIMPKWFQEFTKDINHNILYKTTVEALDAKLETITGEKYSDVLLGGKWNQDMDSGAFGPDLLIGDGHHPNEGGAGSDNIDGTNHNGNDVIFGDNWERVENAYISNRGKADTIRADGGDDVVFAQGGNDTVYGEQGNDQIFGGGGDDYLNGNQGDDIILGGIGNDTIIGDKNDDLLLGQDGNDIIHGGSHNDRIYGGDGHDEMYGDNHEDQIFGGTGNDFLDGGKHDDYLAGESGADYLFGGDGNDVLVYNADDIWGGNFRAKNVGSTEIDGTNDSVNLKGYNRSLDTFDGGKGQDKMVMSDGDDAVFLDDQYSARHDKASGPRIADIEEIYAGAGDDIIDLTSNSYDYGDVTLYGEDGHDVLWASIGKDALYGGDGNDTLFGGGGDDILDGGDGYDIAMLLGTYEDYSFKVKKDGTIEAKSHKDLDGNDSYIDIELFEFSDGQQIAAGDILNPSNRIDIGHVLDGGFIPEML